MEEKLILDAVKNKAKRSPVWMMRQAGRHLPEYRKLKEKYSFLELCQTPDAAVEASLQPIRRYNMDGVICFSDILVPLQAMGLDLDFNPGPVFANPIRKIEDFRSLRRPPVKEEIPHILEILKTLKQELKGKNKTLLGFTGAPFTLASYAIEGKTSKDFEITKSWCYHSPQTFLEMMDGFCDLVSEYILCQQEAGAEVVQLFDTWAGQLSLSDYKKFALPSTKKLIATAKKHNLPIILYINGGSHLLEGMIEANPDVISVDWRMDLQTYLEKIPAHIGVQGNLDPAYLFAPEEKIKEETKRLLELAFSRPNHILNLGHGIMQNTPISGAKAFIQTALEFRHRTECSR